MKKDNLATLHHYDNNQLLSNLHNIISIVLIFQLFYKNFINI